MRGGGGIDQGEMVNLLQLGGEQVLLDGAEGITLARGAVARVVLELALAAAVPHIGHALVVAPAALLEPIVRVVGVGTLAAALPHAHLLRDQGDAHKGRLHGLGALRRDGHAVLAGGVVDQGRGDRRDLDELGVTPWALPEVGHGHGLVLLPEILGVEHPEAVRGREKAPCQGCQGWILGSRYYSY